MYRRNVWTSLETDSRFPLSTLKEKQIGFSDFNLAG
jgi:hypothetical protein